MHFCRLGRKNTSFYRALSFASRLRDLVLPPLAGMLLIASAEAQVNLSFDDGLAGWVVSESGGNAEPGRITSGSGVASMLEGDSFLVTLRQSFLLPANASEISFDLLPVPGFDRTDTFIPDAFEASLLRSNQTSIVATWSPSATSFFNVQENGTTSVGSTTSFDGTTVNIDLGSIVSDEQATLVFDLIGGDKDHGSGVQIDNVVLTLGQATVPNILGLSQSDAEAKIIQSGLLSGPTDEAHSNTIAEGHVISQSPVSGAKVDPGSGVAFVLSLGPAPVSTVPSVVGLSQDAAESEIVAAELTVGLVTTEYNGSVPAGIVIGQDPVGGVQVDPGTEVGLTVSLGAVPLVSVPDVVGLSEFAARAAIENLSLVVGSVSTSESESIPAGHIISQSPAGGVDVPPGSTVDLVISLGAPNEAPEISGIPAANIDEGSTIAYTGSFTDADSGSWTASVDFGEGDGSENLAINALAMTFDLSHVYADNGVYAGTVTIADDEGASSSTGFQVTVNNVAPELSGITIDLPLAEIGVDVTASIDFTDVGVLDTHTATIAWGDGQVTDATVMEIDGAGSASGTHAYSEPGVHTITFTVVDKDGGTTSADFEFVVVYDPSAGFVTGGGWIDSPEGACQLTPECGTRIGRANFGFVSKYKKGSKVPVGQTEFQFKEGDLNFHSVSYEWLVVAGARAQYKGSGTVNGEGQYGFMLIAIDANRTESTEIDLFRIKIWDISDGDRTIYDNEFYEDEDSDPTTLIAGGQIVIHTGKGKK